VIPWAYDDCVRRCLELVDGLPLRRLERPVRPWPDAGERDLVLKADMAFELGGGELPALGVTVPASRERLPGGDEILLYGPDLGELRGDAPYARLALVRASVAGAAHAAYDAVRALEHVRYRVSPRGFMARVSVARERESVRVARDAIASGLGLAEVGDAFLSAYRALPGVEAVRLVFITMPGFPFAELRRLGERVDAITESFDHVLKDLRMDCSSCELKPVCDEVEGLRTLHAQSLAGAARGA